MSTFIDGQKYPFQPNLPHSVNGIIAEWMDEHPAGGARRRVTFQCQICGVVESPWPITTMTIKFQRKHEDGQRRCKDCRIARHLAEYPECRCSDCNVDITGSYYR